MNRLILMIAASLMQIIILMAAYYFAIPVEYFILWFVIYYGLALEHKGL